MSKLILPTRRGFIAGAAAASLIAAPAIVRAGSIPLLGAGGAAGGGGGPFTPSGLVGLIGWWDSSVFASFTFATGVEISAMADQSSAGHNLVFDPARAKPTYNATGFNTTKPALMIDPQLVAGSLKRAPFAIGTGNTLTVWYVATFTGPSFFGTDNGRIISYAAPGQGDFNNVNSFCINRNSNSNTGMNFTRNATTTVITGTYTSPHRYIVTINSSGVQTVYLNGVSNAASTVAGNWVSGGAFWLGSDSGSFWYGPIAEAGIATSFNDATTVGQLDTYLKTKWGLS